MRKTEKLETTEEQKQHTERTALKSDVAKRYRVTEKTVENWCRKGLIPYLKIGPKIARFSIPEVDRALAKRFGRNQ